MWPYGLVINLIKIFHFMYDLKFNYTLTKKKCQQKSTTPLDPPFPPSPTYHALWGLYTQIQWCDEEYK